MALMLMFSDKSLIWGSYLEEMGKWEHEEERSEMHSASREEIYRSPCNACLPIKRQALQTQVKEDYASAVGKGK